MWRFVLSVKYAPTHIFSVWFDVRVKFVPKIVMSAYLEWDKNEVEINLPVWDKYSKFKSSLKIIDFRYC